MKKNSDNVPRPRMQYYDACTLDKEKGIYNEIYSQYKHWGVIAIISFVALGEAHGNCLKKGNEQTNAFLDLINSLGKMVEIVNNENINKEIQKIRELFPELDIIDAVHLATAIKNGCELLKTSDQDLWGLEKDKVKELATFFKIDNFGIKRI